MKRAKKTLEGLWCAFILFYSTVFFSYAHDEASNYSTVLKSQNQNVKDTAQLQKFYQERHFMPLWLGPRGLTAVGENAMLVLKNADQEGLDPYLYLSFFETLKNLDFSILPEQEILRYDSLFTQHVIRYLKEMEGERLASEKINKQIYLKVKDIDPYTLVSQRMAWDPTGQWLKFYTNSHKEYQNLKDLLAHYRKIGRQGGWPSLMLSSYPKVKLEVGKSDPLIEILKKYLKIQGDLNSEDTGPVFTSDLEAALRRFQHRHGLEEDGKLGKETLSALNVPVETRIRQIIISMERWRWIPQEQGNRYVLINIAGYYLQAYDREQKVLEMPVIVGRQFRQTPVFIAQIDQVRFNPSWYVPQSIAVKDKLPILRSNPSYFEKKGYSIYDSSGEKVDPEEIDWEDISSGNFRYKLIQRPGSDNALGKLFFHLNAPFDIFLHGTPDADLFKKAKRSFSSGCIRLSDPVALAYFVLNNDEKWSQEEILQETQQEDTKNIVPPQFINVYVTYQTVWVDDQNQAHFVEDLYGQDKSLEAALSFGNFHLN